MFQLSIDVGGTFADFVLLDEKGYFDVTKVASNREDPAKCIEEGIRKLDVNLRDVKYIFYGSTVGLNTILQKKGEDCALITTAGFRDIYAIGRLSKKEMYNMFEKKHDLLVDRENIVEVNERTDANGDIIQPVDKNEVLEKVSNLVNNKGIKVIAACLINSYVNPENEFKIEECIHDHFPGIYTSISAALAQQWYEFERTCTTMVNGYITPVVVRHIEELEHLFSEMGFQGTFLMMQSNGSVSHANVLAKHALTTLNSGPAAGVIGGVDLAKAAGYENIVTIDMGGTSFDVGVCDRGEVRMSGQMTILKQETLVPSIDIYSIGAGGGSIAWVDKGGALKVGPQSAEADPGPVFYDRGGEEPTVSDANLITGRLNPQYLLGGELKASQSLAVKAIEEKIAKPFSWTVEEAAFSILEIIDNKMAYAIRSMTVEKGLDPSDLVMIAFGGAGALHASSIAGLINIPTILIPLAPGNFSALGMLATDIKHDFVRTFFVRADDEKSFPRIESIFKELEEDADKVLESEGLEPSRRVFARSIDVRYVGQEYTLNTPCGNTEFNAQTTQLVQSRFNSKHQVEYGFHLPDTEFEFTNFRITAIGSRKAVQIRARTKEDDMRLEKAIKGKRDVFLSRNNQVNCTIYERDRIPLGSHINGPALVEEPLSTTLIHPDDDARVDGKGNIVIIKGKKGGDTA